MRNFELISYIFIPGLCVRLFIRELVSQCLRYRPEVLPMSICQSFFDQYGSIIILLIFEEKAKYPSPWMDVSKMGKINFNVITNRFLMNHSHFLKNCYHGR